MTVNKIYVWGLIILSSGPIVIGVSSLKGGLFYYLGIFFVFSLLFYSEKRNLEDSFKIIYILATIIILFTSVFAVIASEKKNELTKNESDLNFKKWLCMEYQNNINTIQEIVDQYNKAYPQLTEQETNIIKEITGLNQTNLQCEAIIDFGFIFLNQHFRSYALKKYFEDNLNLFPDSKINDALDLDYVMAEIAEDKLIGFNNLNSLAISIGTERELPESFTSQRRDIFYDLKCWAEGKLKERLEQRRTDMNCPN